MAGTHTHIKCYSFDKVLLFSVLYDKKHKKMLCNPTIKGLTTSGIESDHSSFRQFLAGANLATNLFFYFVFFSFCLFPFVFPISPPQSLQISIWDACFRLWRWAAVVNEPRHWGDKEQEEKRLTLCSARLFFFFFQSNLTGCRSLLPQSER